MQELIIPCLIGKETTKQVDGNPLPVATFFGIMQDREGRKRLGFGYTTTVNGFDTRFQPVEAPYPLISVIRAFEIFEKYVTTVTYDPKNKQGTLWWTLVIAGIPSDNRAFVIEDFVEQLSNGHPPIEALRTNPVDPDTLNQALIFADRHMVHVCTDELLGAYRREQKSTELAAFVHRLGTKGRSRRVASKRFLP